MLRLAEKLRQRKSGEASIESDDAMSASVRNANIRDRLLLQELEDLKNSLSSECSLHHPDPDKLHEMSLHVLPKEGFWAGGSFCFKISVPETYNHSPPSVRCLTPIWHPNIDEEGSVCLSLLRQSSLDASGWAPTRQIRDVIWGIESLFSDLCDFNDALNTAAAEQYQRDPDSFKQQVCRFIHNYSHASP